MQSVRMIARASGGNSPCGGGGSSQCGPGLLYTFYSVLPCHIAGIFRPLKSTFTFLYHSKNEITLGVRCGARGLGAGRGTRPPACAVRG